MKNDIFNARGMKHLFGRGDAYRGHCKYNLDIWKGRYNRIYMRFWSRSGEVDWESYEIIGIDIDSLPINMGNDVKVDNWIPKEARDAYDSWIAGSY